MISFTPFFAKDLALVTKSSMGVERCFPLIKGIAQKEQGLSHPSAILRYA